MKRKDSVKRGKTKAVNGFSYFLFRLFSFIAKKNYVCKQYLIL